MDIENLRAQIDKIDDEISDLFARRMQCCAEIARFKAQNAMGVAQKSREREILTRISKRVPDPLKGYLHMLYATMFDVSRAYQITLTPHQNSVTESIRRAAQQTPRLFPDRGVVACQGVEGAYSQQACDRLFKMPDIMYFRTFEGVFQAVESGLCEYGVLPIENSSYGSVKGVYDLMNSYKFHIVRALRLRVDHNLLTKPGVKIEDIREVFSHEQAIGQCSKFLGGLKNAKVTVCENTALAARMVAQSERRDVAAISSHNCAELYGLVALREDVQNSASNYTRFICIAKDLAIYPGADHISLMFSTPHRPGALYSLISKFAALGVNLTKLESRPIPGRDFEFMFHFDMEASVWSEDVMQLLGELSQTNEHFVFLGCYHEI